MSLEAVLLDMGDTLLTEQPSRHAIYAETARAHALQVTDAAMAGLMLEAHHGLSLWQEGSFRYSDPWFEAFIERIFVEELGLERGRLDAVTSELFERFEDPRSFRLYPGARELLAAVRELGLRLGIVSNWSARLPRLLEALELEKAFDFVLCSALEELEKPTPELFERALQRAGSEAEHTLHAGDNLKKDGAAAELGMQFVLVDHRGRHEGASVDRVSDLGELLALVRRRAA